MVANPTKRSGWEAHSSAIFSFWSLMMSTASSRSAEYQKGLMLIA